MNRSERPPAASCGRRARPAGWRGLVGGCVAAGVLGGLLCAAAPAVDAGQVSALFTVSVRLLPDPAAACSLATDAGAVRIACSPPVMPVLAPALDTAGSYGARPQAGGSFLDVLPAPEGVPSDLTNVAAGEDAGPSEGEDLQRAYAGSLVDRGARVQSPTRFGEFSTRTVSANGYEYVEMTVSW